jgi:hypothetical protein
LVRVDGDGELTQLMPRGTWNDTCPRPVDARQIVFASNRTGSQQIFLMDLESRESRAISEADGQYAVGSPRGRWIAYSTHTPGGIWLRAVDGKTPSRRLTDDPSDDSPIFSHDGQQVIFERGAGDESRLWIVAIADGVARPLVSTHSMDAMTSPADDRVFFIERHGGPPRLMVTDERGALPRPARASLPATGPSWSYTRSRDGRRILLAHNGYEIVELAVDSDAPPVRKHRLTRWIVSVAYAPDDAHAIAAVNFGDGDLWLAEGRFR